MAVKTMIKGEPYAVTKNEHGWQVTATGSRIDRIGRTYQVWVGPGGRPAKCSCPDHANRKNVCKHMAEANRLIDDETTEVSSHTLEHPTCPRCYRFGRLQSGRVRYERWEGGTRVSSIVLDRDTAAKRWTFLVEIGYRFFGAMSRGVV